MLNLRKKYGHLPTVMDYKDQIRVMKDLASIGASKLVLDRDGMMHVFDNLMDSHQSNGVFEFNEKDKPTFIAFIELLRDVGKIIPELNPSIEKGMIGTFEAFGFDADE